MSYLAMKAAQGVAMLQDLEKREKLAKDLAEDPAGLCPARCDTERRWGHSYVNGVCEYCDRVED